MFRHGKALGGYDIVLKEKRSKTNIGLSSSALLMLRYKKTGRPPVPDSLDNFQS